MSVRVCVFGSSSTSTKKEYVDESIRLGELIADQGHICVNGGGLYGVMGGANEGAARKSGKIRGIIHKNFAIDRAEDKRITDLVVVDGWDLSNRKTQLFEESDCVIVMPGGVGTFDEFWDGVCAKSLNMKNLGHKPICLVNLEGFYDGFIAQLHRAHADGVLYVPPEKYFRVEVDVEKALHWCVAEFKNPTNRVEAKDHAILRKLERSTPPPVTTTAATKASSHPEKEVNRVPLYLIAVLALGVAIGYNLRR
jgi:uncharacterized protein (TIGR00730 family)